MKTALSCSTTETSLLATFRRNRLIENRHWGWLAVSDAKGTLLYSTPGSDKTSIFLRSTAKPFQAMPLVRSGLHQTLRPEELAIACASHVASPYHTQLVASLLQKAGISEHLLACGAHPPLDQDTRENLIRQNESPNPLHNNCSGKHAGMLYYCSQKHLPLEGYLDPHHPLQQEIQTIIQNMSGLDTPVLSGIDGCGAPTYYLPITNAAQLYARLGSTPEYDPIVLAMTTNPEAIGGKNRVDTAITKASKGRLLAKVGADGLIGISHVEKNQGLILKIADGNTAIRNQIVVALLKKWEWILPTEEEHPALKPFQDLRIRNIQNQVVGKVELVLPE